MKNWLDSYTVRYLVLTFLASVLLQLVPMLQSKEIDWWSLGSQAVATLAALLVRVAQGDVQAPIDMLNRSNPK